MKTIRVLLVDDHTLVRAGLRALLASKEGIQVVAEAGDGREALKLTKTFQPDVIVMDIGMPSLNGIEAAERVSKEFSHARVLMLSMHKDEEYVWQALKAGAKGYLVKDVDTAELEIAVRAVARGETYLSPAVSKHLVADYVRRVGGEPAILEPPTVQDLLTPRQREILQLIAEGSSSKEIAQTLNLSVKTVETHRTQLMGRLDIHDVAGLVRYAIRVGLVSSEH